MYKSAFLSIILFLTACDPATLSLNTVRSGNRQNICQYIQNFQTDGQCSEEQAWTKLSARISPESMPSSHISLFVGGDPGKRVAQLLNEGFIPPGRDLEPWPFTFPLQWNLNPFEDRNWMFHLHAWRMIDPMIMSWEQTGDAAYLELALNVMVDWHDFHFYRNHQSEFQWYDMSVGLRAMKIAYILERVMRNDVVASLETRQILVKLAHTHAQSLTDPNELSRGNHGLFQLHGLMALCLIIPDVDTCQNYDKYVATEMKNLLMRQFGPEGIHIENAPEYHFFVFNAVNRMLKSGWYQQFDFVGQIMEQVAQNRFWMVHPDGTILTIGDSEPKYVRLNFPDGNELCRHANWADDHCIMLKSFEETGYAIVRSDWAVPAEHASMLFFVASFHDPGHKLPDDLSFEWYDNGSRILTNAGKYSYNSNQWRDYVTATRAHNTVEVDGKNYSRRLQDAYGSALQKIARLENENVYFLQGKIDHTGINIAKPWYSRLVPGISATHERTLVYKPRQWLAVIDNMTSGRSRIYTQWFHFAPDIEVIMIENAEEFLAIREDGEKIFIRHISRESQSSMIRGQKEPFIQGWTTKAYGQMEPRYSLGFTNGGKEKTLITIFSFNKYGLKSAEQTVSQLIIENKEIGVYK